MKNNWIKIGFVALIAAALWSGCGIGKYQIEISENTESSDRTESLYDTGSSAYDEGDTDSSEFADDDTASSSVLEGKWFAFETVKRNKDTPQKVTFDKATVISEEWSQVPCEYKYDESSQMLEIDYTEYIEYLDDAIQTADEDLKPQLEEFRQEVEEQYPDRVDRLYASLYDGMLFLYADVSGQITEESWEYGSPDFPNTILALSKDGKYYELINVFCRKPEFPSVKSLSLALGYETLENCLASYYSEYPGVFSYGMLERVYGITDCDIIDVFDIPMIPYPEGRHQGFIWERPMAYGRLYG